MKIAFTGAQSTGKTTLLKALQSSGKLPEYKFIDNITRSLLDRGININESGTDETQLALIDIHKDNLQYENFVADRCIIDCCAYSKYQYEHDKISYETLEKVVLAMEEYFRQYDVIFFLRPEFDLIDDGVRSSDLEFRDRMVEIFDEVIALAELHLCNIVVLTGSVEERLAQIYKTLEDIKC